MDKVARLLIAVVLVLVSGAALNSSPAHAATPPPSTRPDKTYDLTKVHCSDLLQANIMDRSSAIMFLWGFEAGKRNITTFDTTKLEAATHGLMETCEAKPSLTVFAAIDKVVKNYGP